MFGGNLLQPVVVWMDGEDEATRVEIGDVPQAEQQRMVRPLDHGAVEGEVGVHEGIQILAEVPLRSGCPWRWLWVRIHVESHGPSGLLSFTGAVEDAPAHVVAAIGCEERLLGKVGGVAVRQLRETFHTGIAVVSPLMRERMLVPDEIE